MSSFLIELDTTGPKIEANGPAYSTRHSLVEILVVANEKLSRYQDFYLLDSKGARHDVIFDYQGDHFIGELQLNDFPIGMATFYATVKDDVLNFSNLATHTIKITDQSNVGVSVNSLSRRVVAADHSSKVRVNERSNSVAAMSNGRRIKINENKREIGVSESNV